MAEPLVNIDKTSNVGIPGQGRFQVDGETITVTCSGEPEGWV